jgi:2-succinyl-6-hydroxy-2,4-cyclohexadiene-1-carboxylate synthase
MIFASVVVLMHGFTHTGASWEPVLAALGERYRGVIAPDIRGHGSASNERPVSLEAVIEDVAELSSGKFDLVGYSMGGRLALHVALALPDRVGRVVLIGASPGIEDPDERAARVRADEALADSFERMDIEEVVELWERRTPMLAGVHQTARADRLRNTPAGLARALRGLGTGALPSAWGRLEELQMPVVLVVGERDAKFRAIAGRMAGLLPRARVVVVDEAGHAVHLEMPERVAEIVAAAEARA